MVLLKFLSVALNSSDEIKLSIESNYHLEEDNVNSGVAVEFVGDFCANVCVCPSGVLLFDVLAYRGFLEGTSSGEGNVRRRVGHLGGRFQLINSRWQGRWGGWGVLIN